MVAQSLDLPSPEDQAQCQLPENRIDFLRFNNEFIPSIRKGLKRATTRLRVRCVKPGQQLSVLNLQDENLGFIRVTKAELLTLGQIHERLAKEENTTIEGLRRGLTKIYGPQPADQIFTAIYFVSEL